MFTLKVTDELELALIEPAFAKDYLDIATSQRDYLSQWLAWPQFAQDRAFFLEFIQKSLIDYANGKSLTCAILFEGQVVGNISFNSINHDLKKVEIGYWLSQKHQGKGIVSRAVAKLTDIAFTEMGMTKVQISAAIGNQPSRNVCERLGFKLEGILTQEEQIGDRLLDHAIYGLQIADWQS
ncbi:Putative ribosomal N-acetyltransferase YdaF [Vibrio aerogenes CECT 7868]|uniref:Putative ribosomal N-acetyltransferase YdaF n=1 Tax=Vibrio aerogenes CECT 7868 TaxID=1216006 RepID=A0A1M5ZY73_9VIBR|nr:GNAT family protein [Vibrio aerogenes]SHI29128.1 Putative ribosomal N-acetyltransferase YdaF [Vibrio aerogenes CECT 7868]